jgi:type I restriction enzyme, R subunit
MAEKLEVVQQMFSVKSKSQTDIMSDQPDAYVAGSHRFDYRRFFSVDARQKLFNYTLLD